MVPPGTAVDPQSGSLVNAARVGHPLADDDFFTLSPVGGASDDAAQINAAIAACPAGQVVKLTAGVFNIISANIRYRPIFGGKGDGSVIQYAGITIRGAGPGKGLSTAQSPVNQGPGTGVLVADATATILNNEYQIAEIIDLNGYGSAWTSYNLASDAIRGEFSCTLSAGFPTLSVVQVVRIDQNTSLAAVATVSAASSWTTSSTTITMSSANPGGVVLPGMFIFDNTTQVWVGYVQSWIGTTLTLTTTAKSASSRRRIACISIISIRRDVVKPEPWWAESVSRAFQSRIGRCAK
jgi:hypothetical protein